MKCTQRFLFTSIALMLGCFPSGVMAQQPDVTYVVHLAQTTQWGPATLRAGDYRITRHLPTDMLTVEGFGMTLADGGHPVRIFLKPSSLRTLAAGGGASQMVLAESGRSVRVAALQAEDARTEFRFDAPAMAAAPAAAAIAGRP